MAAKGSVSRLPNPPKIDPRLFHQHRRLHQQLPRLARRAHRHRINTVRAEIQAHAERVIIPGPSAEHGLGSLSAAAQSWTAKFNIQLIARLQTAGRQSAGASVKPENSNPGATRQETSVQWPSVSAVCQ